MGRKNKQNEFEVIVPMDDERTKVLKDNDVLNRLYYLEHDYKPGYDCLIKWVYTEFKSIIPDFDPAHSVNVPLTSILKSLPSDKFDTFLDMLGRCEDTLKFNKNRGMKTETKEEVITRIKDKIHNKQYISFTIARYALTDVIEELHKSNAKDIIVTKEDGNFVVKYKPGCEN